MIRKHTDSRAYNKKTLFCSILVYILYTIKKLKSQKNNYCKRINKISYLKEPKRQQIHPNTESYTFKQ